MDDLVVITGFSAPESRPRWPSSRTPILCVDNLPPETIRSLLDLFMHSGARVARAAVVSDARGREHFEGLTAMLDELRSVGVDYRILFLEADEETCCVATKSTLAASAGTARDRRDRDRRERELLAPLRERADIVIDTNAERDDAPPLADRGPAAAATGRLAITFQASASNTAPAVTPT